MEILELFLACILTINYLYVCKYNQFGCVQEKRATTSKKNQQENRTRFTTRTCQTAGADVAREDSRSLG